MKPSAAKAARGDAGVAASEVGRDRYLDVLCALAFIGLVTYRLLGWQWLPLAYPSMGVLFTLAGASVAGSLLCAGGDYRTVFGTRMRRLLPPFWLYGAVIVSLMLVHGWTATGQGGGDSLRNWRLMLFWLVPVATPPSSDWGHDFVVPLWFITVYLWLLLLSPALLFLYRRWPMRVMAVPLAIVAASTFGFLDLTTGRGSEILLGIGIYGPCWMLGFARQSGRIRSIPAWLAIMLGVVLLCGGLAWAISHRVGWTIDDAPLAAALYSLGAALLLMRFTPSLDWVARLPVIDSTVTMISSRALTIYLWHSLAIFLASPVLDSNGLTERLDNATPHGALVRYAAVWLLTIAALFLFGWVEDLAAGRPPRMNPWPRRARGADLAPSAAAVPQFAGTRLRRRPVLFGFGVVVAAALATGAALWPWSNDHHRSNARSLGTVESRHPGVTTTPGSPSNPGPTTPSQRLPGGGAPGSRPASPDSRAPIPPYLRTSGTPGLTGPTGNAVPPAGTGSVAPSAAPSGSGSLGSASSAPNATPTSAGTSTPAPAPSSSTPVSSPTGTAVPSSAPGPTPVPTAAPTAMPSAVTSGAFG